MSEPDNLVLRSWTTEAWTFVNRRSVTTEIAAGEVLCRDSEPFTHFIFPQAGMLSVQATWGGKSSVEMMSVGREGLVGLPLLNSAANCEGDIRVLVSGSATFVPLQILEDALAQFSCVRQSLSRYGAFQLQTLMQMAACDKIHSSEQRLALWLLVATAKLQSPAIPITHAMLSGLLGLRRATVTTVLAGFVDDGSIETARGTIRIADSQQLQARCGRCFWRWQGAFNELVGPMSAETRQS